MILLFTCSTTGCHFQKLNLMIKDEISKQHRHTFWGEPWRCVWEELWEDGSETVRAVIWRTQSAWKPSSGFTGKAASYGVQSNWATWACWLKAELWRSLAHLQEMSMWLAEKITHPRRASTWSIKQLWWPVQWSNSTAKNSSIKFNVHCYKHVQSHARD